MLQLMNITPTKFFYEADESSKDAVALSKNDLVVCHYTDTTDDPLIAASFVGNDFALTTHLLPLLHSKKDEDGNPYDVVRDPRTKVVDVEATITLANKLFANEISKNLHGFVVAVSDIIPEAIAIRMNIGGTETEIGTRRIVGVGKTEEAARIDAISREAGRLKLGIAKSIFTVVTSASDDDDE